MDANRGLTIRIWTLVESPTIFVINTRSVKPNLKDWKFLSVGIPVLNQYAFMCAATRRFVGPCCRKQSICMEDTKIPNDKLHSTVLVAA